jgi:hypothetical protein
MVTALWAPVAELTLTQHNGNQVILQCVCVQLTCSPCYLCRTVQWAAAARQLSHAIDVYARSARWNTALVPVSPLDLVRLLSAW